MKLINELKANIQRVRRLDASAHSNMEVLLLYPHIKALILYRLAHPLYLRKHYFLARFLSNMARNMSGIEIHPGAKIGKRLFIDHGMGVVIGETAIIGDDVLIYHGVTLGANGKVVDSRRHPIIGDGVTIGANALVLGPIEIGAHNRIAANAVVTKSSEKHQTLIGMPARAK